MGCEMNLYMEKVRNILWRGLPYERVRRMNFHIAVMERELEYLKLQGDARLCNVERAGWTIDVLGIICVLSVFYHYIIGPLSVGGRGVSSRKIPGVLAISHGDMLLNGSSARSIEKAYNYFLFIMNSLNINFSVLCSVNVRDIIYYIEKSGDNEED